MGGEGSVWAFATQHHCVLSYLSLVVQVAGREQEAPSPVPPDCAPIVRGHLPEAQAWLVATDDPCRRIATLEIERIHRRLVLVGYDGLHEIHLSKMRCVAFLICTNEEYRRFLDWAYQPWNVLRRTFLFAPRDRFQVLIPGGAAHHIRIQAIAFQGFPDFHKEFGLLFNWIVYRDAKQGRRSP